MMSTQGTAHNGSLPSVTLTGPSQEESNNRPGSQQMEHQLHTAPPPQSGQHLPSIQQQLLTQWSYYPYTTTYQAPLYMYPVNQQPSPEQLHVTPGYNTMYASHTYHHAQQLPVVSGSQQDLLYIPQRKSSSNQPISPLNNDSFSYAQYHQQPQHIPHHMQHEQPKPMFQLPSQATHMTKTISLSESAVAKAIETAEAIVAKEAGHITRRRRKALLTTHLDSKYECEICGKAFHRPYNLKSHLKTHSTEKPFLCKYCNSLFARSHDRRRHEKLHEGEKKFRCGGLLKDGVTKWGCNRRFARADALGRHFRTETGWNCIEPLMMEARESEGKVEPGSQALELKIEVLTNLEILKLLQDKS